MKKSSSPMPCCLASVLTSSTRLSRTVLVRAGRGGYQKLLRPGRNRSKSRLTEKPDGGELRLRGLQRPHHHHSVLLVVGVDHVGFHAEVPHCGRNTQVTPPEERRGVGGGGGWGGGAGGDAPGML